MRESWQRIERWLESHAPEALAGLNPPASEADIRATEQQLGVQFPPDVRALYRIHDGQESDSPWILYGWEWLSLEGIRGQWKIWKDLLSSKTFDGIKGDGDGVMVRADWWNPAWIPLTYSGDGDHHCLDLSPGPSGNVGQVIEMWHDDGRRTVLALSMTDFLERFAEQLEAGEYVYSPDYNAIVNRNEV